MLHIVQGLTNPKMKPVKTELSDFEAITRFKTIQIKPEQKLQMVSMRNGTTETLAKASLCWYFIAGELLNEKRSNANLINRSLLILDYDDVKTTMANAKKIIHDAISEYAYFLYPSTSYTQEKPKFRLVVDAERGMNKGEYQATIKSLGELIGLPYDDVSHATWSQLMGCPITDDISEFDSMKVINEGEAYPVSQSESKEREGIRLKFDSSSDKKKYTASFMEELMLGAANGERNVFLTKNFGRMVALGMDLTIAYEWIKLVNENFLDQPVSMNELNAIVTSIAKREQQKLDKVGGD